MQGIGHTFRILGRKVQNPYLGTGSGQTSANRFTDPLAPTGHHCYFSIESKEGIRHKRVLLLKKLSIATEFCLNGSGNRL
jgi:hypothetical protein